MLFMLLINYDPTVPSDGSPSKQPEHAKLSAEMRERGHHRSGAGLWPVEAYVRRFRPGKGVTDGPFAETREVLGGYYVVDCSEEEALEYAARIPVDSRAWIEIRKMGILDA